MENNIDYQIKLMQINFPFLTLMKKNVKILGREEEINILHESLHKKRLKNTILIGNAGCGKTAIIEKFSSEIKEDYYVMQLDLTGMVAGTALRGEFEQKVFNCLKAIKEFNSKHTKEIILFIDEIHMMYTMGQCRESDTATLGNMIKPYLSDGSVTVIGATTEKEYNETIRQDKALVRRLCPIYISNLDIKTVEEILYNFGSKKVPKQLIRKVIEEATKLDGNFPDIGIELLDRCLARSKYRKVEIDEEMIEKISLEMKRGLKYGNQD